MATMIVRPMEDASTPMGHTIVHATKVTTATARSARMSMSAQPFSVVLRVQDVLPMQIALTPLDHTIVCVDLVIRVMVQFVQISTNVPVITVAPLTPGAPTLRARIRVLAMLVTVALVSAALTWMSVWVSTIVTPTQCAPTSLDHILVLAVPGSQAMAHFAQTSTSALAVRAPPTQIAQTLLAHIHVNAGQATVDPIARISTSVRAQTIATPMHIVLTILVHTRVHATSDGPAMGLSAPISTSVFRLDVMSMPCAPTHLAHTLVNVTTVTSALAILVIVHKLMSVRTTAVVAMPMRSAST